MPEIKQPEQLSLGLEDTRKGLFIDIENFNRALEQLRVNIRALDAIPIPRAPQPAREREQRVERAPVYHRYLPGGIVEIYAGPQPENP